MIPTYCIAIKNSDNTFSLKDWYIFEGIDLAQEAMEVLSAGKPINDFCIMQAVWNEGEIVGWVFMV